MPDDATITRPAPSAPSSSIRRRRGRILAGVAALALVLGVAACSDDGGGEDADTDRSSTTGTTEPVDASESSDPSDATTTTVDNSQGRPLNENDELAAALVDPGEVAEGLEVDPGSVGDGSFHPTLCPDRAVEVTWDDQVSQGLLRTGEGGTLIISQSVLAFADADAADAFLDQYVGLVPECNPEVDVQDTTDVGDRLVRVTAATGDEPASAVGAFIRQGSHVSYVQATGDPAADLAGVVDDDLLDHLAGLLPA